MVQLHLAAHQSWRTRRAQCGEFTCNQRACAVPCRHGGCTLPPWGVYHAVLRCSMFFCAVLCRSVQVRESEAQGLGLAAASPDSTATAAAAGDASGGPTSDVGGMLWPLHVRDRLPLDMLRALPVALRALRRMYEKSEPGWGDEGGGEGRAARPVCCSPLDLVALVRR